MRRRLIVQGAQCELVAARAAMCFVGFDKIIPAVMPAIWSVTYLVYPTKMHHKDKTLKSLKVTQVCSGLWEEEGCKSASC